MPLEMMSGWGADIRLPIGALFILIGFLDWRLPTAAAQRRFVLVVGALALTRVAAMEAVWRDMDPVVADFQRSLAAIAPGSRILVAEASDQPLLYPLRYLPCLATIERSSLVSLEFSNPHHHNLTVRPAYRGIVNYSDVTLTLADVLDPPPPSSERRVYWRNWTSDYDYFYVLWMSEDEPNPAPDRLSEVFSGRGFRLYRVLHPS
jgi:hypothetical protein